MLSISLTAVPVLTLPASCRGKTLLSQVSCFFSIVFFVFFLNIMTRILHLHIPQPHAHCLVRSCSAENTASCPKIPTSAPPLDSPGSVLLRFPPRSRSAQMQCEILSDTLRSLASVHIRRRVSIRNGTVRGGHPHCDFLP